MRVWLAAALLIGTTAGAQQVDSSRVTIWAEIFTRARQAEGEQDFRRAKILYDSVIALDPRNSMAYMHRGLVLHNLSDDAASRADLEKSVALGNPMAASFLSGPGNLASTPVDTGAADRAKRAFDLNASGMSKLADGDTAAAMVDLKQAAELGNASAGFLYANIESRRQFEANVRRAAQLPPPYSEPTWGEELLLLLGIVGVVALGFLIWIKLTPAGLVPDDELEPGEKMLWLGAPKSGFYADLTYIPSTLFAFIWIGMLYAQGFRLTNLGRDPEPFTLFQLLFVGVGVWMLVGRYFLELRQRKQTTYLLTEKRLLVTRGSFIIEHKMSALKSLKAFRHMDGTWSIGGPGLKSLFRHIEDGDRVLALIEETRAQAASDER